MIFGKYILNDEEYIIAYKNSVLTLLHYYDHGRCYRVVTLLDKHEIMVLHLGTTVFYGKSRTR